MKETSNWEIDAERPAHLRETGVPKYLREIPEIPRESLLGRKTLRNALNKDQRASSLTFLKESPFISSVDCLFA